MRKTEQQKNEDEWKMTEDERKNWHSWKNGVPPDARRERRERVNEIAISASMFVFLEIPNLPTKPARNPR